MQLNTFLNRFFKDLESNDVDYCVLRNYQNLPEINEGNDIDVLVSQENLKKILNILQSYKDLEITGVVARSYVHNVFIFGVEWGEFRSIQLDFITELSWKGQLFLDVKDVLSDRLTYKNFYIPSPIDEAIVSFFTSLLYGAFIKEKYLDRISHIVSQNPAVTKSKLTIFFGSFLADKIVRNIQSNDMTTLLEYNLRYKISLIKSNIRRSPLRSIHRYFQYYKKESLIRLGRKFRVVFLGPDGAGKSTIINKVKTQLGYSAKPVEIVHLRKSLRKNTVPNQVVDNPHAQEPRNYLFSFLKLIYWVFEYKVDQIFNRPRVLSLSLYDRYYHDLLIDARRYRYKGNKLFIRLFSVFIPKPILWVVLIAPPEILYHRKQEVGYDELVTQVEEYKRFHQTAPNSLVIDTSQPLAEITSQVSRAIAKRMNDLAKISD